MSDYEETIVAGTKWQRCNSVHIENPYQGTPNVRMGEELVASLDGAIFIQTAQGLDFPFDPAIVIGLRNPATNELTGQTMTGMDLYIALFSLYLQKAGERDAHAV